MKVLVDIFSDFPEPRCLGKVKHRFIDILVIAVTYAILQKAAFFTATEAVNIPEVNIWLC
ncbi:hypothetical protein [Xenorhabdus entomophaga]|uniref:hypothetical protein n=1 Tax=Xenorhabdus entomophaga TaxID=3136257 RepID=UPI0030F40406